MPSYPEGPGYAAPQEYRPDQMAGPGYGTASNAGPYPGTTEGMGPHPYWGQDAHAGQDGYGETVNGGSYAYVIRDDDQFVSRSPRAQRASDRPPGSGRQPRSGQPSSAKSSPAPTLSLPAAGSAVSGVTRDAGAHSETDDLPAPDGTFAYGPDDPAYGPPGPARNERAEEASGQGDEDELGQARGAFEPLPPDHTITPPTPVDFDDPGSEAAGRNAVAFDSANDATAAPDRAAATEAQERPSTADDMDAEGESIDDADEELDVALVGRGDRPIERIRDLYLTAETIGDARLDKHFDQLLERQRQLISEYFTTPESRKPAASGRREKGHLSFFGAPRSRP